jgi:hypothetical protein
MKHFIFASLISLLSTSAFSFQVAGDPCKCPSGTCPGYTVAKCGFPHARKSSNDKNLKSPPKDGTKVINGKGNIQKT